MRWYAESPARRSRQVLTDLLVLGWVVAWMLAGWAVHGAVSALAAPADPLRRAGSAWADRMTDVADRVVDVPVVGNRLDDPFTGAATAGHDLVAAGDQLQAGVTGLAWAVALAVAATPILLVGALWLALRLRYARRAGAAVAVRDRAAGHELLALRALTGQPLHRLRLIGEDPVQAWRRGDPEVTAGLAALELRRLGLRAGTRG